MPKKLPLNLIYLGKTGLKFIYPNQGVIRDFAYPPDVIKDLEILPQANIALTQGIAGFIAKNKINPSEIIYILSPDICFEKDFPTTSEPEKLQDQINSFVDSVPFESLTYKTMPSEKNVHVTACNRNFYDSIKGPFEHQGFITSAIFPLVAFNLRLPDASFSLAQARSILKKIDAVQSFNLLTDSQNDYLKITSDQKSAKEKERVRLGVLVGIFVLLLLILVLMLIQMQRTPSKPKTTPTPTPLVVSKIATPKPSPTASVSAALASSVKIEDGTSSGSTAGNILRILSAAGFKNVAIEKVATITQPVVSVVFSTSVNTPTQEALLKALTAGKINFKTSMSPAIPADIIISLGNQ